ncbi:MAG: DUF4296 domain-containing protein [Muribaculaceae bacterium]|nr:DUF4296 domain-containing protein [Muribaculaceae bacterium]
MFRKIFSRYIALFFSLLVVACSDRPENIPSDSKMVKVMADMEMAQAYVQSKGYRDNNAENRERILKYVLEKNGMSREDFDSTLSWYGRHIDKYDDLYAKVDKELARRESKISGNNAEMLSNDLWPYSRYLVISSKSSSDNLSFRIPTSEVEKGDRLSWKFRLNMPTDGNAMFGVKYTDGTMSYVTQNLSGDNIEVSLQTDSARRVKDIFGNLKVNIVRSFVGLDSLTLSAAPFDSTIYYRISSAKRFSGPKAKIKKPEKKDSTVTVKDSLNSFQKRSE